MLKQLFSWRSLPFDGVGQHSGAHAGAGRACYQAPAAEATKAPAAECN